MSKSMKVFTRPVIREITGCDCCSDCMERNQDVFCCVHPKSDGKDLEWIQSIPEWCPQIKGYEELREEIAKFIWSQFSPSRAYWTQLMEKTRISYYEKADKLLSILKER